jgi:hypothetical protein
LAAADFTESQHFTNAKPMQAGKLTNAARNFRQSGEKVGTQR